LVFRIKALIGVSARPGSQAGQDGDERRIRLESAPNPLEQAKAAA
jgi:hypothetical protein